MFIFTMYGGGFATIPAYLADLFGTRFVGGIHGRLLTAWSVAGALGPLAITWFRGRSVRSAIDGLVGQIDPDRFQEAFGASVDELELHPMEPRPQQRPSQAPAADAGATVCLAA